MQPRRFGQALAVVAVLASLARCCPGSPQRRSAAPTEASAEAFTPRTAGGAAGGREAGVREHDRGVVRHLPGERTGGDLDGGGAQAFARDDVAYLKGDWTRQDPAITAFLREHGRDGVPLYVFFPRTGRCDPRFCRKS